MQRLFLILSLSVLFVIILGMSAHHDIGHSNSSSKESIQLIDERIIYNIKSYAHQQLEHDLLIEYKPNLWVKNSNVNGIHIDNTTYYYSLYPHMSYDPLTRGDISTDDIDLLYEEQHHAYSIFIYTIKSE